MSEQSPQPPETSHMPVTEVDPTQQPQEVHANATALQGLKKFAGKLNAQRLEHKVAHLEKEVETVGQETDVNANTARRFLIPGRIDDPNMSDEDKTAQSKADKRAVYAYHVPTDGTVTHDDGSTEFVRSLRPTTRQERRQAMRMSRKLRKNMRGAQVNRRAELIYDIPDPEYQPEKHEDKRPDIGNRKTRELVDEKLRRAGLLDDRPPQEPTPMIQIGSKEHRELTESMNLTPRERRSTRRASRIHSGSTNLLLSDIFRGNAERNGSRIKSLEKVAGDDSEKSKAKSKVEAKLKKTRQKLEKQKDKLAELESDIANRKTPEQLYNEIPLWSVTHGATNVDSPEVEPAPSSSTQDSQPVENLQDRIDAAARLRQEVAELSTAQTETPQEQKIVEDTPQDYESLTDNPESVTAASIDSSNSDNESEVSQSLPPEFLGAVDATIEQKINTAAQEDFMTKAKYAEIELTTAVQMVRETYGPGLESANLSEAEINELIELAVKEVLEHRQAQK